MAREVVWLRAALDDLDGIAAYIAADSPAYAAAVISRVLAVARSLSEFPLLGRRVPEWDDDQVRERIVHSFRLVYQVLDARVVVLAVIHGARLLPDDLRERTE
jgi:toxin ParE1/3/4